MKIEKRGKYAGVKVHLEPEECEIFMQLVGDVEKAGYEPKYPHLTIKPSYFVLTHTLGKKIVKLLKAEPTLLMARTPEEIKHELEVEFESAKLKLDALTHNQDWKEIHVK